MDATELMVGSVVVGAFRENCYIVGSKQTGEAICVDPGDEPDEIRALARDLKLKITKIACSHGHLDHIMAVRALKEETGAPFKKVLNDAIREGLRAAGRPSRGSRNGYRQPVFDMGLPAIDLTKVNEHAAELEDIELVRKMQCGR